MTTINITRRKQPIGFVSRLIITTTDGESVSLRTGETATVNTNGPIDKLYVKRFWRSQTIKTGITDSRNSGSVNLELYHDLSPFTMCAMLVVSVMLVLTAFSGFSSKRYIPISLFLILIVLIAKVRRNSLLFKQLSQEQIKT